MCLSRGRQGPAAGEQLNRGRGKAWQPAKERRIGPNSRLQSLGMHLLRPRAAAHPPWLSNLPCLSALSLPLAPPHAAPHQALVRFTLDTFGHLDILVSNAAVNPASGPILDMEASSGQPGHGWAPHWPVAGQSTASAPAKPSFSNMLRLLASASLPHSHRIRRWRRFWTST